MKCTKLKPEVKAIWEKLNCPEILNDVFVRNEFHKRNLSIKDAGMVTLVFDVLGKVHVHGHASTESHSPEIAIMKNMIKDDIVNDPKNYEYN